jgi:hypothetical protein
MATPPWITSPGIPQKRSDQYEVKDLYKSSNVYIDNVEVVLYDAPNPGTSDKAAFLISIDGDGVTDDNQDQTLGPLNQQLAEGLANGTLSPNDVTAPFAPTTVASVTVDEGGANILGAVTMTFSGGGEPSAQAEGEAVIVAKRVVSVILTDPGANYTLVPTITTSDPNVRLTAVMTPTPQPPSVPAGINGSYASVSSSTQDFGQYNQDNIPYNTLRLTPKTMLADFTTRTALWSRQPSPPGPNAVWNGGGDNKYIKAQYGLTVPQILTNLADLAANIWEPLKARYPGMIITNTFRQGKPGGAKEQAQHGRGQAFDAQLPGASYAKYYEIACWMRDNLPVGQLLQERSSASPASTWIHCSYENGKYGIQVPKQNKVANLDLTLARGAQFHAAGIYQYV